MSVSSSYTELFIYSHGLKQINISGTNIYISGQMHVQIWDTCRSPNGLNPARLKLYVVSIQVFGCLSCCSIDGTLPLWFLYFSLVLLFTRDTCHFPTGLNLARLKLLVVSSYKCWFGAFNAYFLSSCCLNPWNQRIWATNEFVPKRVCSRSSVMWYHAFNAYFLSSCHKRLLATN